MVDGSSGARSPGAPRVSVVMPVHNGETHLREAVDSILGQSFGDFEFLILDDASTDATAEILAGYARDDPRIRLMRNERNLGLTPTLNRGLAAARAPIVARMDADDISAPERLARQVAFLDANPDHLFVATSYRAIDAAGRTLYVKVKPADDFRVRWLMRFRMCLEHPSACFRARLPDGAPVRYDDSLLVGEDFEFFARLIEAGRGAILKEVLYSYRKHPASIMSTRRREVMETNLRIARQVQRRALPPQVVDGLEGLLRCYLLEEPATPGIARAGIAALDRMLAQDVAANPAACTWLRRQAAGILADAILRFGRGAARPGVLAAFLLSGRRHLWPLAWRFLEDKGLLPGRLESFAEPVAPAAPAVRPARLHQPTEAE